MCEASLVHVDEVFGSLGYGFHYETQTHTHLTYWNSFEYSRHLRGVGKETWAVKAPNFEQNATWKHFLPPSPSHSFERLNGKRDELVNPLPEDLVSSCITSWYKVSSKYNQPSSTSLPWKKTHHHHNMIQIHDCVMWDRQYFTEYSPNR